MKLRLAAALAAAVVASVASAQGLITFGGQSSCMNAGSDAALFAVSDAGGPAFTVFQGSSTASLGLGGQFQPGNGNALAFETYDWPSGGPYLASLNYMPRWWDAGVFTNLALALPSNLESAPGGPSWNPAGTALVAAVFLPASMVRWIGGGYNETWTEIYSIPASGAAAVPLTADGDIMKSWPTTSPDGTKIVFGITPRGTSTIEVAVMPAGGGAPQILDSGLVDGRPSWSPDSTRIAYTMTDPTSDGVIRVRSLVDGTFQDLGPGMSPSFSPDGAYLAWVNGGTVVIQGLVDPTFRVESGVSVEPGTMPLGLSWSPGSNAVAFVYRSGRSGECGARGVAKMDLSGAVTILTQPVYASISSPQWQPLVTSNAQLAWKTASFNALTGALTLEVTSTRGIGDKVFFPGLGKATWKSGPRVWSLTVTNPSPTPARYYACGLNGCITK